MCSLLILGGGQGTRLFPHTEHRSKPAVPIGGTHRRWSTPGERGRRRGSGHDGCFIRNGIMIVPKDGVIEPGTAV